MDEEWRDIVEYKGIYQVSNLGRVRNITKNPPNMLRIWNQKRYAAVRLCIPKRQKNFRVHRLVALAFLGTPPAGFEVNHIDGNKWNNCVSNLEYVTPQENIAHSVRIGLMPIGERVHNAKLNEDKVRLIRRLGKDGIPKLHIARQLGVSERNIRFILLGLRWGHVKDE